MGKLKMVATKKETRAPIDSSVRRCVDCGNFMVGQAGEYDYTECGLSSVKLLNVMVYRCDCGSVSPEINAIDDLHSLIAVSILQKEALLSGEEVRFLRKVAGFTQAELAEIMGVHKTTPTGWETGAEPIGKENDRVLRSCCFFGMMKQIANTHDPVTSVRAAASVLKSLDIREVFKRINDALAPRPKDVCVGNDPEAAGVDGPWFLPENRTPAKERCM